MAGRSRWTGYISAGISVGLAVLILTQIVVSERPKPHVLKAQAEPVQATKTEQAPDPIPAALVLPSPPPPPAPNPAAPKPPAHKVVAEKPQAQKQEASKPNKPTKSPKIVTKPSPAKQSPAKPSPANPKPPEPFVPAATDVVEGRALLRTLEHGKGPLIEIAWPNDRSQHGQLFHHMTACLGMRVAVMDAQSILFVDEGQAGHPWDINLDRYSGFLRQPAGWLSPSERKAERAIRRHHNMDATATSVRIFPRPVDAALLGGLRKYVGDRYAHAKSIHARYRLDGAVVIVEGLNVDGQAVPGRIGLKAQTARCAWRT